MHKISRQKLHKLSNCGSKSLSLENRLVSFLAKESSSRSSPITSRAVTAAMQGVGSSGPTVSAHRQLSKKQSVFAHTHRLIRG